MLSRINIRNAALALFMGVLLVVAVIPICQMVACDAMTGTAGSSQTPALAASCTPSVTGWLSSGAVTGSTWSATLRLVATFVAFALAAPAVGRGLAMSESRVPARPEDPLGVRILV